MPQSTDSQNCPRAFARVSRQAAGLAAMVSILLAGASCTQSGGGAGFGISGKAKFGEVTKITVDRIQVEFPVGAILDPDGLNIQILPSKVNPASGPLLGPRFVINPADAVLGVPVTVRYNYNGLVLPTGALEPQLTLASMGPTGLLTTLASTVSTTDKVVTTQIAAFTTIALTAPGGAVPVNNGNGILVFLRNGAQGKPDVWRVNPDGTGAALVLAHTPGETLSTARVSTVAGRVAFTESVNGDPADTRVYIANLDGSNRTLVTAGGAVESLGDLNIDGTQLFVKRREPLDALADIVVYNLSTPPPFGRVKLTDTPGEDESNPKLSPSGELLLFQDGKGRLRRTEPIAGAKVFSVTSSRIVDFSFSPDSTRVVVQRPFGVFAGFGVGGGIGELNPAASNVSAPAIRGTAGGSHPTYSPGGENIIFEYPDTDPAVGFSTLRQVPRVGGLVTPILLGGGTAVFPGAAPTARPQ